MHEGVESNEGHELTLDDVGLLLKFIDGLDCAEVDLTLGNLHLVVRRQASARPAIGEGVQMTGRSATSPLIASHVEAAGGLAPKLAETTAEPPRIEPEPVQEYLDRETAGAVAIVRSPMVGLFYRSPEPRLPPFVDVGSVVDEQTVVCLVEVMKLFHSVTAGASGVVQKFFVGDGATVEYMQPLLALKKR
jgi:acetyl-CoA carboxylase biotin carboxyl carrier protein